MSLLILLIIFDFRITLKVSYFYQTNLNAILTEYDKGLQGYIKFNDKKEIFSAIRIAEQVNICEYESINNLSITNALFAKQNQKLLNYIKNLYEYTKQVYNMPMNKGALNELLTTNERIIVLTSEIKSKGIIKTLSLQKQVNHLIDESNSLMIDSAK